MEPLALMESEQNDSLLNISAIDEKSMGIKWRYELHK